MMGWDCGATTPGHEGHSHCGCEDKECERLKRQNAPVKLQRYVDEWGSYQYRKPPQGWWAKTWDWFFGPDVREEIR